jgi:hypothetical protein
MHEALPESSAAQERRDSRSSECGGSRNHPAVCKVEKPLLLLSGKGRDFRVVAEAQIFPPAGNVDLPGYRLQVSDRLIAQSSFGYCRVIGFAVNRPFRRERANHQGASGKSNDYVPPP